MMKANMEISDSIEAMKYEVQNRIKTSPPLLLEPRGQFILCKQRVLTRHTFQKKWPQPISLTFSKWDKNVQITYNGCFKKYK